MNSSSASTGTLRNRAFFSLLQKNFLNRRRWDTREDLHLAIVPWIERITTAGADRTASDA